MRRISLLTLLLATLLLGAEGLFAQAGYKNDGSQTGKAGTIGAGGLSSRVLGPDLNVFNSAAMFNAATPGATLTTEDFESVPIAFCSGTPPLSSATNDACFANSLQPGFAMDIIANFGTDYVAINGLFGLAGANVGPITFADDTRFDFNPTVTAASFNITSPLADDDFTVEVFNGATSLGTFTVTTNLATPVFAGMTTNNGTPITHFTVVSQNGTTGELFDDLTFGQLAPPPAVAEAPIPTMGEWALMIFGLLIINMGVFYVRRKQSILG